MIICWTEKSLLSKGNDGTQGSQGPTGPPGSPGSPGLMVYACYIFAYYLYWTNSYISVNYMLYCILSVFAMKGPPWHWGIGWKIWETRTAGELHTPFTHTQAEYPNTHWSDPIVSILHSQGSLYSAVKFCCFQGLRGDSVLDVIVIRSLKKLDNEEMKLLALSKG